MTASTRPLGITLVALSALAYSTAGFFTRLIPLDAQTILLYRGIVAGLFIAAFCAVMEGRNALRAAAAIGRPGLLAALCSALATILFINAFRLTSVADVVILFATAPFVTAAISRVVYGVRESRATLIASTVALAGVAIMMGGAGSSRHVLGDLMAIGMTLLMSIMIVIVRQNGRPRCCRPPHCRLSSAPRWSCPPRRPSCRPGTICCCWCCSAPRNSALA